MGTNDPNLPSFRAGDYQRRKPGAERPSTSPVDPGDLKHFPFLEQLLESDEEAIEHFQQDCQATCHNLDTSASHQSDPAVTAMCQAALSAYGQSLKLFSELINVKYDQLRQQAGQDQEG